MYAYVSLHDASDKAESTQKVRAPQLTAMSDLELAVTRSSLQLRHAMLARTPEERDAALADIAAKRKLIAETMTRYEQGLYTDKGKAHWLKVYEVPSLGRAARGKSIVNLLQLEPDERITGAIPVKSFESGFIILVTKSGSIVKMPLQAFSNRQAKFGEL